MSLPADARVRLGPVATALADHPGVLGALEAWWRDHPADRGLLQRWIAEARVARLVEAFGTTLPFGTGGRRGRVGPGPGHLHPEAAAATARAHAAVLVERAGDRTPSVVVGWDTRAFHDTEGHDGLDPARHPYAGLSSRDLATAAAAAYRDAGVAVWWPDAAAGAWPVQPTPAICGAVPAVSADGALVVTASHNPPDDNGLKLYDAAGGQLVGAAMQAVLDAARSAAAPASRERAPRHALPDAALQRGALAAASLVPQGGLSGVTVVLTPLHGTGHLSVAPALEAAGARVVVEPSQGPDGGRFATLGGRAANPEDPSVLARALATAERVGARVVLATDPDADRLGLALREEGDWTALDGHELATLVLHHRLATVQDPAATVLLTTEVTTALLGRMARAAGARVVADLPVGFKHIGAWLSARGAEAPALLLGAEESHGLLADPVHHDKDAAQAAVLAVAAVTAPGWGGWSALRESLAARHGRVVAAKASRRWAGAEGARRRAGAVEALGRCPPDRLGDDEVLAVVARGEVVRIDLGAGGRALVRPSGTEPKVKVYAEAWGDPTHAAGQRRAEALADALIRHLSGA